MADDGDDWFAGGGDDEPEPTPAAPEPAAAGGAAAGGDAAPAGGAAPADQADQEPEEAQDEGEYLDPDKFLVFKHWIRPKFLQYRYLYDYRHNYYDDVIDYLDKRQHGLGRDIPRAQTWGERVLRTYCSKIHKTDSFKKQLEDVKLVEKSRLSGAFFRYHSKEYINRRYSTLLY